VHEEDVTKAAPSSTVKSPAPTASADDADDVDKGRSPDRVIDGSNSGRDEADLP
jgi:hypothetical protein